MTTPVSAFSSLIHPEQRTAAIRKENEEFFKQVQKGDIPWTSKKLEGKNSLNRAEIAIFHILNFFIKLVNSQYANKVNQLFAANDEAKSVQEIQRKIEKLHIQNPTAYQPPYVATGGKLDLVASTARFQALKAQVSTERMKQIGAETYLALPKKLQKVIQNIAELHGFHVDKKFLEKMLAFLGNVRDSHGDNVFAQIEKLLAKKQQCYWDLSVLNVIADKCAKGVPMEDLKGDLEALGEKSRAQLLKGDPATFPERVKNMTFAIERGQINKINHAFDDILNKVDHDLAIYEISPERLISEMSDDVLKKPVSVTLVSAEFKGLASQGGLAEAVQGMAKGLKEQNPANNVRVIFPKYSHLPKDIQEMCKLPTQFLDRFGHWRDAYKIEIKDPKHLLGGIEVYLIDDPTFEIKEIKGKRSIYDEGQEERFPAFSGLAADLIKQLSPTDLIHLHDWHVGGVGLRLKADDPNEWKEGKIPPIVFTYHNNNRAAQGRLGYGAYNYGPIIAGFVKAGVASKDTNVMVDILKTADSATTVSETFGIESQMPGEKKGEGVSFAVREAAAAGKLTGVINGSNPESWNPETNAVLKNWKEIPSGQPLDLTFRSDSPNILEQKKLAKEQLAKWVNMVQASEQGLPKKLLSGSVDFSKPLLTFIGRFDAYQKGLDKLDEAIQATIKSGGQFIVMGLDQEDKEANKILDALQKKYPKGVLFIRDYLDPKTNRPHYQFGAENCPAIGAVVRAATEYVFIPSSFEPCGLVQFEGWLFGSLAIGSNTGGLADTINPSNGFLFEREGNRAQSVSQVIPKALESWRKLSDSKRRDKMKEVMLGAKKCGWSDNSKGYSAIEKYRFVYENARRRTAVRGMDTADQFTLESYYEKVREKSRIPSAPAVTGQQKMEELYHRLYADPATDSNQLDKVYQRLSPRVRSQVPSPYGKGVNFETYQEFGAHVGEDSTRFNLSAPEAKKVQLKIVNRGAISLFPMKRAEDGSWSCQCRAPAGTEYQFIVDGKEVLDPYGLQQTLGEMDFSIKAPNATSVQVKIKDEMGTVLPLKKRTDGTWIHSCRMRPGLNFEYIVDGKPVKGSQMTKAPYSVVIQRESYDWHDSSWMQQRAETVDKAKPMSLYEVHSTSWKKKNGEPLNYRELAQELVSHCKKTGYSHVELIGILDYPADDNWSNAYQVTGFFAPNKRLGSTEDFKYLVDTLHRNRIGVVLDFVPAHFASDPYSLSALPEYAESPKTVREWIISAIRRLCFPWGTTFFDLKKKPVREFLTSSAAYWLKEMHVDGLRIDAVRPMLLGNLRQNHLFLKDLNAVVHQQFPGAITIAEDFSSSPTTHFYANEGIGFDYKWHIGWVHKVVDFFQKPLSSRRDNYETMVAAASDDQLQQQVMALSHDQTKEGRMRSLLEATPGLSMDQKFANLRAMLGFMMSLPGKKLMFMGGEFGTGEDWTVYAKQQRRLVGLADSPEQFSDYGKKTMAFVKAFNTLYRNTPALYEKDNPAFFKPEKRVKEGEKIENQDLQWLVKKDPNKQVIAYRRSSQKTGQSVACLHNFTDQPSEPVKIKLPQKVDNIVEILNSDDPQFGGSGGVKNQSINAQQDSDGSYYYMVVVPPLATIVINEGVAD